ncbi:DUF952 domain-containing protein [Gallaecimonas xiamenensis]|uniref:DUF952 domain-containing protein n=1 Tax=Gallaecimonas xiamenensis TaxID=1207039 RepID=UPI00178C6006
MEQAELVANLWLSPEENPVVLEIDVTELAQHLKWEARIAPPEGLWPSIYMADVPIRSIAHVDSLSCH